MSIYDELYTTNEGKKALAQESLILDVTERIHELLERKKLTRVDLAKRLKVSKGRVSKLLSGQANMTLRTLADIGVALDAPVKVDLGNEIHEQISNLTVKVDNLIDKVEERKEEDLQRQTRESKEAVIKKFMDNPPCNEERYHKQESGIAV